MSSASQVIAILAGMSGLIGLQSFWIGRSFDGVFSRLDRVDQRIDRVETRLDRVEDRLDRLSNEVLREHAQRIARLEERLQ